MDTRLSISNRFIAISFNQFLVMLQEFKQLVESSFGTSCKLEVRAMNQIKMSPTRMHDDDTMAFIDQCNRKAVFYETANLSDFPEKVFDEAVYIEAVIVPVDRHAAPQYAFAHVEFKGSRPRQATFYMQPRGDTALQGLKKRFRFKKFGDGYTHNTDYR